MNRERLRNLVAQYVDQFDFLNNEVNNENMKWRAIHHFKTHFDLQAPDFYRMFQEAMAESSIIINNAAVQPINGILKLILHEEDTVRQMFARLYEEDGGDLERRQANIEAFVHQANQLLERYERGKWKYKQDFRSVLAYLTFYHPEENYLYKSSQCQPFFRYLEYGEEIGYGQYFKLSRYYRMCDEVRAAISGDAELMEVHRSRRKNVEEIAGDLHILTFDLIYCSIVYGFYKADLYQRVPKQSKTDSYREHLNGELEGKQGELEILEKQLGVAEQVLDALPEINVQGREVRHKTLGRGKVLSQSGTYIEVAFHSRASRFVLTTAVVDGFLSFDDPTILEQCKKIEAAITCCKQLERSIQLKHMEIHLLTEKIIGKTS